MEPINEFSPLALIGQTAKTKKDKKRQRFYQNPKATKSTKKVTSQTENFSSDADLVETERRSGEDRRTLEQQQKRFDLRTKFDRRKSSALSLKI